MTPRNPSGSRGDNGGDMRASWSPEDVEAALRGHSPVSADVARLAPAIEALRARSARTSDPDSVAAMAAVLARETLAAPGAPRAAAARSRAPWRRRLALTGVAAILASAGLAGTAAAADGAAPGDPLYGLDRALEAVGIGDGGSHERIQEATKLADEGEVDAALRHAADALAAEGDSASAVATLAAADALASHGSANSAEVHARVSEMLRWMSQADVHGSDFGHAVSAYARGLGVDDVAEGDDASPAAGGDDQGTLGNSGNAGKPDDGGKPEDTGKSDSGGKPEDTGKPDSTHADDKTPSGASEDHPGRGHGG